MNLTLLLLFVLVFLVKIRVTLSDQVYKCCAGSEILTFDGNSYKCAPDITRRLQIYTDKTDFLKANRSGNCTDVLDNNFITFYIEENRVELSREGFFPKCCPLNTVYNSKLHSCIHRDTLDTKFINGTLIKVGLANCKVVEDFTSHKLELDTYEYDTSDITIRKDSFCVDKNEEDLYVTRKCRGFDICNNITCIKKCCPDGQSFVNGSKCRDTYEHGLDLSDLSRVVQNYEDDYAIIHNRTCSKLYLMSDLSNITIHKNGNFTEQFATNIHNEHFTDTNSYCIEHTSRRNTNGYYIFHCFPDEPPVSPKFRYRLWSFLASCLFLVFTVAVYITIKEWKKMFGKILINYCVASFCVYGILTLGQLYRNVTVTDCHFRAFSLIFFAISQFSWANVMSFEIWCTFGSTKIYLGSKRTGIELKKFLLYLLYGWGGPLIITLITLLFYKWRVLPYAIQPFLTEAKCFFDVKQGNYAKFLFLNMPMLIVQLVNMVLFAKTIMYCVKVRNEINKINDVQMKYSASKYRHDRERICLIFKLSIVMGISYIFEVITAFFNMSELGTIPTYIEIALDNFNALQGVFIFIIFICKKRVLLAVAQKCYKFGAAKNRNSSSTRTQSSMTLVGIGMTTLDNQTNNKVL